MIIVNLFDPELRIDQSLHTQVNEFGSYNVNTFHLNNSETNKNNSQIIFCNNEINLSESNE